MSTELVIKGFFALLMSGAFAYTVFSRQDTESGEQDETSERYLPYISGLLLPLCLLTVTLFAFIYLGREAAAEMMLSFSFGIFLHIALYYALLLLLLPLSGASSAQEPAPCCGLSRIIFITRSSPIWRCRCRCWCFVHRRGS